jgi:hypothetical protein
MPNYDHDFNEFMKLMKDTTANLKKMREMQEEMRWQFGEPQEFTDFLEELQETRQGWVSSNC